MPSALGFTGEQTDPLGLVNLRARTYNPRLGAFTSVDPVLGVGGSTGWNGYLYANANPANLTDASGMCPDGYDFVSCLLYDANTTLTYGPRVFGHLWDIAFGSKQQFAEDLKDSWKDGLPGWWNGLQETLPHVWDFTFQVAIPMLWEPADWISALVNGDPLALLPLVPSAARFASHASSPLSIGRRAANHLNQSIPAGALCSFDADTIVATSEGSLRIDQLKVDDKVLAYDEDSGEVGEYSVTAVLKHDDPIIIHLAVDGETVDTTPEHPFYTEERGWVAAGELQIGDHLRRADGGYGVVQSIHTEPRTETMYNLTVEEAHTFFVGEGQWLVHNECKPIVANGRTLFVGEGQLGFARDIAEIAEHPELITATIYEDFSNLTEIGRANKARIEELGGTVLEHVDARNMHGRFPGQQWDTIIFHFPHTGKLPAENRLLLNEFFESANVILSPTGVVHSTLSDNRWYNTFGIRNRAAPFFAAPPEPAWFAIESYRAFYPNWQHMTTVSGREAIITGVNVWRFTRP